MNNQRKIENLFLYLIWVISATSLLFSLVIKIPIGIPFYFGLGALVIATIIFFQKPNIRTWTIFTFLLLSTFSVISFNEFLTIKFDLGLGSRALRIDAIPLTMLIILSFIRREWIKVQFMNMNSVEKSKQQNLKNARIEEFVIKFENLTTNQIQSKLTNDLQPEAKSALNEILEKRKTRYNTK